MLFTLFMALYVAPTVVTLLGGIPFVAKDRSLAWPLVLFATIPLFNIFLASTVIAVGWQMLFDKDKKKKGW